MRLIILMAIALAAAACSKAPPVSTKAAEASPAPYSSASANAGGGELDVDEVMIHVMDPAARAFWTGWGEVYDSSGLHDVSAKTDEDWERVEDGATTVIFAVNALMAPPYQRKPEDEWNKWATRVAELARQGKEAAANRNVGAMEVIGGNLNAACNDCHKAFRSK